MGHCVCSVTQHFERAGGEISTLNSKCTVTQLLNEMRDETLIVTRMEFTFNLYLFDSLQCTRTNSLRPESLSSKSLEEVYQHYG